MGKGAFRELDDGVVHDEVDDGQDGEQEEGYWAGKHGGRSEGVRARGAPEGEHEEVEDVREGLEIVGKCEGTAWVLKGHSGAEKPGSL